MGPSSVIMFSPADTGFASETAARAIFDWNIIIIIFSTLMQTMRARELLGHESLSQYITAVSAHSKQRLFRAEHRSSHAHVSSYN